VSELFCSCSHVNCVAGPWSPGSGQGLVLLLRACLLSVVSVVFPGIGAFTQVQFITFLIFNVYSENVVQSLVQFCSPRHGTSHRLAPLTFTGCHAPGEVHIWESATSQVQLIPLHVLLIFIIYYMLSIQTSS
jgi:hypothetical protein